MSEPENTFIATVDNGITGRRTPVRRRSTLADVAQIAGVSRAAVSYVLSERTDVRVPETTRRRILEAADQVGYRRNALGVALRSGRMDTVGIITPVSVMVSEPGTPGGVYYKDLTAALAAAAFEAGLNPLLMSEQPHHSISLADLSDRRVDGIILVAKADSAAGASFVKEAADAGVPCVTISRGMGDWQVQTDNVLGGSIATRHLLDLGHRRIAYLSYDDTASLSAVGRHIGYQNALREAGIAPDPALRLVYQDAVRVRAVLHSVRQRAEASPTAFFCFNDELVVWLFDLCREESIRIPEDLSVVGFDNNIQAVTVRPRLTTIHSPLKELAQTALMLFQQQLRGESPPPAPVQVSPHLVVRDSAAAFPFKEESK